MSTVEWSEQVELLFHGNCISIILHSRLTADATVTLAAVCVCVCAEGGGIILHLHPLKIIRSLIDCMIL